ncbi:MAG: hypothetical protein AAB966_03980 [Patescibacteria group bacterium]
MRIKSSIINRLINEIRRKLPNCSNRECRHGAVNITGGKATHFSMPNTRAFIEMPSIHAEIMVLLKAERRVSALMVIRFRYSEDGDTELVNSKPCKNCIETMHKHGVNTVFYSDENGKIVMERVRNMTNRASSGWRAHKRSS